MRSVKNAAEAADRKAMLARVTQRAARRGAAKRADEGSEMLHIRVDRMLKRDAVATLDGIGLSMSDAVRLFLRRVVIEQALPLQLKVPNATTRAAIEAARALGSGEFTDAQELFDALEEAGER